MSETDQKDMPFLGHLEEFRWRLVRSSVVILAFAIVFFVFTGWILEHILLAHSYATFPTYILFGKLGEILGLGQNFYAGEIPITFQSLKPTEQFSSNIFFSIVGGIIISFPYFFFEIWGFIKPALKNTEKNAARGIVLFSSVLFFIGIGFGYFLVTPLAVQFFGGYQMHEKFENNFTVHSFLSLIVMTTFFTGLFFQLPVIVYITSKIGILSSDVLKKFRKHSIIVLLVLAAVITPPDIISQIMLTIPLMLLYEMGILIAKRVEKKRKKAAV